MQACMYLAIEHSFLSANLLRYSHMYIGSQIYIIRNHCIVQTSKGQSYTVRSPCKLSQKNFHVCIKTTFKVPKHFEIHRKTFIVKHSPFEQQGFHTFCTIQYVANCALLAPEFAKCDTKNLRLLASQNYL